MDVDGVGAGDAVVDVGIDSDGNFESPPRPKYARMCAPYACGEAWPNQKGRSGGRSSSESDSGANAAAGAASAVAEGSIAAAPSSAIEAGIAGGTGWGGFGGVRDGRGRGAAVGRG